MSQRRFSTIRKFLEEKCLVSQNYVKFGDITVQQLLDQNDAKMVGFSRLVVGEGIEKKGVVLAQHLGGSPGRGVPCLKSSSSFLSLMLLLVLLMGDTSRV